MVNYEEIMSLAIQLAKKGKGYVSPNPLVGAVIVKDGNIISTGYHHRFGDIHAEIDAINNAGDIDFINATLVVNLEPCSHHGKQPPCAEKIAELNFKHVVIGMQDPNPQVAGKGIKILGNAGIKVSCNILESECKWLNRVFIKHIKSGMPYVSLKNAQSINGAIATRKGDSKWISCETSRRYVHKLRAEYDAVAVGKNTALLDNPELTVRMVEGRNPFRIVFDTELSIPEDYKLLSDEFVRKTIVIASAETEGTAKAKRLQDKGINILFEETGGGNGKIELRQTLKDLYNTYSIASILVEGGGQLFNSFLATGEIDEYHLFVAPKIIADGINPFAGAYSVESVSEAHELDLLTVEQSGEDLHLIYVRKT